MKHPPPLRHSFPAVLFLMGVASVLFLTVFHFRRFEQRVIEDATMETRMVGTLVAMQLEKALRVGDHEAARDVVSHLSTHPRLELAALADPDGQVRFATEILHEGKDLDALPDAALKTMAMRAMESRSAISDLSPEQRVHIAFPISFRKRPVDLLPTHRGALILRYDLSSHLSAARGDALMEASVAGSAVLAMVLLTYLFIRFALLGRLRRLIVAAAKLASGDYASRADLRGSDEVSAVAQAFDRMAVQLEQRTRELRENEESLRSLIESLPDALLVVDGEGMIRFANPSSESVLGRAPQELAETCLIDLLASEDRERVAHALRRLHASGHPTSEMLSVSAHVAGRTPRPLDLLLTRPSNPSTTGGLLALARDVTERHRLEQQLILSQKLEAVARLAGGVAHDFNNLLAVVLGATDALRASRTLDDESRAMLDEIRTASMRGASLTKQLLAMGRSNQDDPGPLDVNDVLAETDQLLRRLLPANIHLQVDQADDLPPVMADRTRIAQVLMNLVLNARDAMPRGGRLHIRTRSVTHDGSSWVELEVLDTGVGMDEGVRERIFEPFFTTKGTRHGTGLGLPTVHHIVQAASGTLHVDSAPGRGTTVHVRLPAATASREEAGLLASGLPPSGRGEHILLVEDELQLRRTLTHSLENHGYRVTPVATAEDALARVEDAPRDVHLVLTDLMLPGMSGWDLLLQVSTRWHWLPVMIMSGHVDDERARAQMMEEGVPVLLKPFETATLLVELRHHLDASVAHHPPTSQTG